MTPKHILIVEDERPIREMIAFGLKRAGFEVREAEDSRAARSALADQRPDLLLVDWMLPDTSGLELTRALKRDRETRDLPVIMLTARASEADKVAGSGRWRGRLSHQAVLAARAVGQGQRAVAPKPPGLTTVNPWCAGG